MTTSSVVTVRLHETVLAACPQTISIDVGTIGNSATVTFTAPGATGPQLTAGQNAINAFDWSAAADTAWQNLKYRVSAKAIYTASPDDLAKILRAVALVIMDQFNIMRAAVLHPIVSITRVTTVATVTTPTAHGKVVGDPIAICGAAVAGYNLTTTVATVVSTTVFTYTMANAGVTPATGSLFYSGGAIPQLPQLTPSQISTAIQNKIDAGTVD